MNNHAVRFSERAHRLQPSTDLNNPRDDPIKDSVAAPEANMLSRWSTSLVFLLLISLPNHPPLSSLQLSHEPTVARMNCALIPTAQYYSYWKGLSEFSSPDGDPGPLLSETHLHCEQGKFGSGRHSGRQATFATVFICPEVRRHALFQTQNSARLSWRSCTGALDASALLQRHDNLARFQRRNQTGPAPCARAWENDTVGKGIWRGA